MIKYMETDKWNENGTQVGKIEQMELKKKTSENECIEIYKWNKKGKYILTK